MQATTGCLLVFQWEFDDATVPGPEAVVDYAHLGERVEALRRHDNEVSSMWASGGRSDRFDIFFSRGDRRGVIRVDGAGRVLRVETSAWAGTRLHDKILAMHRSLLGGAAGGWLVALSALLLLTNLVLGLRLALNPGGMPRRKRSAATPRARAARLGRLHRRLGLVGIGAALVTVTSGLGLLFLDPLQSTLGDQGAHCSSPQSPPRAKPSVADVARYALESLPGSRLSYVELPEEESGSFRVGMLGPAEFRSLRGASTVEISSADGRILRVCNAGAAGGVQRLLQAVYPVHTGQIGGTLLRAATLLTGLWLLSMIVIGICLWWSRRPRKRKRR
jgi:uncharacterized iron-regulated membrane protein